MYEGKTLFAQIMDLLPWSTLQRIVTRYGGDYRIRTFRCAERFRIMSFAQLTYRESLRDIEACLPAQPSKLYHMGLRGVISSSTLADDGKWHDVNILDLLMREPGAFYVMDRGYLDFARLYALHQSDSFFVTQAKSNLNARRLYLAPVERSSGVICDHTILLNGFLSHSHYPENLRRIRFKDADSGKTLIFLTNHTALPALTICALYKKRWQIELFFKWIKQNLRIKRFYGVSENAVKTQIWIAVSTYLLIAIIKKRLNLEISLYTLLQILSVTLFEKKTLATNTSDTQRTKKCDEEPEPIEFIQLLTGHY